MLIAYTANSDTEPQGDRLNAEKEKIELLGRREIVPNQKKLLLLKNRICFWKSIINLRVTLIQIWRFNLNLYC